MITRVGCGACVSHPELCVVYVPPRVWAPAHQVWLLGVSLGLSALVCVWWGEQVHLQSPHRGLPEAPGPLKGVQPLLGGLGHQ